MSLDSEKVAAALAFDPAEVASLRQAWLRLLDLAVWGDLVSSKIGALPRLRKRLLETGEDLRSLVADRQWIPQPRERLKSALGSSVKLRDGLLNLERAAVLLDGGADFAVFERALMTWREALLRFIEVHEQRWAGLLDGQYDRDDCSD